MSESRSSVRPCVAHCAQHTSLLPYHASHRSGCCYAPLLAHFDATALTLLDDVFAPPRSPTPAAASGSRGGMAKQDAAAITDSRPLDGGRVASPAPAAYTGGASAAAAPSTFNPAYSYGPSVTSQAGAAFTGRSGNAAFGSPEASAVGTYGNQGDGQDWK